MFETSAIGRAIERISNETVPLQLVQQSAAWSTRGSWILHSAGCEGGGRLWEDGAFELTPCSLQSIHAVFLLLGLCTTLVMVVCAFAFFREDKEEQITPLCPQMVVRDSDLSFTLPLPSEADCMSIMNKVSSQTFGKVSLEWPDPFRPGASGVAATVRLQNAVDSTLATVVARNVAVVGQGLALCRAGCEIFGFVEPEGPRRYHVRHRTGVHLLTLVGDFASLEVEGINPVGSKVCWFQKVDGEVSGRVLQHVDAGLAICSVLATHIHRRLMTSTPAQLPAPFPDQEAALQQPYDLGDRLATAWRPCEEDQEAPGPLEADEAAEPRYH